MPATAVDLAVALPIAVLLKVAEAAETALVLEANAPIAVWKLPSAEPSADRPLAVAVAVELWSSRIALVPAIYDVARLVAVVWGSKVGLLMAAMIVLRGIIGSVPS